MHRNATAWLDRSQCAGIHSHDQGVGGLFNRRKGMFNAQGSMLVEWRSNLATPNRLAHWFGRVFLWLGFAFEHV